MNTQEPYRHLHFDEQSTQGLPIQTSTSRQNVEFIGNVLVASLFVAFFGSCFSMVVGEPGIAGAWKMMLMAGSGWLFLMAAAAIFLPENRRNYFHGLSYLMANGIVPLIPAAIILLFSAPYPLLSFFVAVGAVLVAYGYMLHMHLLLVRRLNLSKIWPALWTAFLFGTAAIWFLLICETDFSCIFK